MKVFHQSLKKKESFFLSSAATDTRVRLHLGFSLSTVFFNPTIVNEKDEPERQVGSAPTGSN